MQVASHERIVRWDRFLKYIAVRARMQFLMVMNTRGYQGQLKFHHLKKQLDISVKTDDSKEALKKDASTLSGGS